MMALLCFFLTLFASLFKSKSRLEAENAALRHQLIVLQRRVSGRVQLANGDRLFLVMLYRWFPSNLKAITIILDRQNITSTGNFAALQIASSSIGIPVGALAVRDGVEIEKGIDAVAREPSGSLIFLPSPVVTVHRERIVAQVNRRRLPAIYPYAYFAKSGGLVSYGIDIVDLYRRATPYIDRLLHGANPGDLPVQQPTKFELVINLKTAKALGLDEPPTLLARADEVIE
jgi:putative tryptophan/tyrosine transport system substrate-binding protein